MLYIVDWFIYYCLFKSKNKISTVKPHVVVGHHYLYVIMGGTNTTKFTTSNMSKSKLNPLVSKFIRIQNYKRYVV